METDIRGHYAAGTYFVIAIFLRPLQARTPHSRGNIHYWSSNTRGNREYIRMFVDWHEHVAILLLFNETSDFLMENAITNNERTYAAIRIIHEQSQPND